MITSSFGKTLVAIALFILATILVLGIIILLFIVGVFFTTIILK